MKTCARGGLAESKISPQPLHSFAEAIAFCLDERKGLFDAIDPLLRGNSIGEQITDPTREVNQFKEFLELITADDSNSMGKYVVGGLLICGEGMCVAGHCEISECSLSLPAVMGPWQSDYGLAEARQRGIWPEEVFNAEAQRSESFARTE